MKNVKNAVSFVVLVVALMATASVSWAAGGYQYNLGCTGCHGNPPLDTTDKSRNIDTGGFAGNHQTHTVANKCVVCHTGTTNPSAYKADHRDGKIQMFSKYGKGTFFNQTSIPLTTNATCATINCHFENPTTPNWLTNLPAIDCTTCHASPPSAASALSTQNSGRSHDKHYSNSAAWGSPFGTSFCVVCHTDGGTKADGTPNWAAPITQTFQHATSVTWRPIHIDTGINYTGNGLNFLPSQSASRTLGTCNNTYCHSNGVQGAANVKVASPAWGTLSDCTKCHAATPTTNSHNKHVTVYGSAYYCQYCHNATTNTTSNSTITDITKHTNQNIDIAFGGIAGSGTWTPGTKTCSATYCHGTGAPVWGNAATAACGTCHKATGPTTPIDTKAHFAHFTSAYGPKLHSAVNACATCHTTYPATKHADGVIDANFGATCLACHPNTTPLDKTTWAQATASRYTVVTCNSCHVKPLPTSLLSVINGKTAPEKTSIVGSMHALPDKQTVPVAMSCQRCHNQDAPHIGNAVANTRLTFASVNAGCADCHTATKTIVRASFTNMSTHISTKGAGQDANFLCTRCHDPHAPLNINGVKNLSLIRASIKKGVHAAATSFNVVYTNRNSGWVDLGTNRGLCQVCHTKTKYYLSGVAETSHPTSDCFTCHTHNARCGAFKPTGMCDGCHGYPPMPRGYAVAGVDFGVAGSYANAKFEDYSGGGGAHAIAAHVKKSAVPSEGWANCAVCHNGGEVSTNAGHKTAMPIKANIKNVTIILDQKLKFNNTKQVTYSSAKLVTPGNKTGTCYNADCHFKPSPKWSIDPNH